VSGRFRIGLEWIETRAMTTPVVSAVPWVLLFLDAPPGAPPHVGL
jgi:hypothetical protein